jgi:hypothetical protein
VFEVVVLGLLWLDQRSVGALKWPQRRISDLLRCENVEKLVVLNSPGLEEEAGLRNLEVLRSGVVLNSLDSRKKARMRIL